MKRLTEFRAAISEIVSGGYAPDLIKFLAEALNFVDYKDNSVDEVLNEMVDHFRDQEVLIDNEDEA